MTACASTSTRPGPGIVIGRRGAEADRLKKKLEEITGLQNRIQLNIQEIKQPELDAALIAQGICDQLVRRVAFRRAMKRAIQTVQKAGALGVRVQCAGRLGGSEMSRKESTARAGCRCTPCGPTSTTASARPRPPSGRIGVKVWIYKGDILPYKVSTEDKITREAAMAVGETSGQSGPRRLITAGGGRRRAEDFATDDDGRADGDVEDETVEEPMAEATEAADGAEAAAADGADGGGRGRSEASEAEEEAETPVADLLPAPAEPDELERLLTEDEEIERQNRHEHHETPHFRKESD